MSDTLPDSLPDSLPDALQDALSTGDDGLDVGAWSGRWVERALGLHLHVGVGGGGLALRSLVGLAVRRNPRRAHLLVSRVLGKHVPTDPDAVYATGRHLGELVVRALVGPGEPVLAAGMGEVGAMRKRGAREQVVVLGYAETATALGHVVADVVAAPYLHSTRRRVEQVVPLGGFEESHSHAADHLLLPADPQLLAVLDGDGPLVLVDDEISTGSTALHTIEALQQAHPRRRYVLATLVDLRSEADRARMADAARAHGVQIDVVALATGSVDLPDDVLARGERVVSAQEASRESSSGAAREGAGEAFQEVSLEVSLQEESSSGTSPDPTAVVRVVPRASAWGPEVKEGGRHGFLPTDRVPLELALAALAADVTVACGPARRVHVLGFEELMYAPLRLAQALKTELGGGPERGSEGGPEGGVADGLSVTFSTTTSSPILVVDDPGYPIRTDLVFPAHDGPAGGSLTRHAYNIAAPASDPATRFDTVVLVVDTSGDRAELTAPGGLVPQLAAVTDRVVLVVLPEHLPASERP